MDSVTKKDRFDSSLDIVIGVKNDMVKTLSELKKDATKQSRADLIVEAFRKQCHMKKEKNI